MAAAQIIDDYGKLLVGRPMQQLVGTWNSRIVEAVLLHGAFG
jgi:hypothetical protein